MSKRFQLEIEEQSRLYVAAFTMGKFLNRLLIVNIGSGFAASVAALMLLYAARPKRFAINPQW
jgi:hypothetical protein